MEAGDQGDQWQNLDQWRKAIITQRLRFQADRLGVDLPAITDVGMYRQVDWDDDKNQPYYLTDAGIRVARDIIRAEAKHRQEVVGFWVTCIVGVIGALTGLVSAFRI